MATLIIQKLSTFRNRIKKIFNYSKEATMNLIDAIAGLKTADSIVKISLSSLFFRNHGNIFYVIKRLFWGKSIGLTDDQKKVPENRGKELSEVLMEYCPIPSTRSFLLFATDSTPQPRMFAEKLEDRKMVYSPNKVAGIPVTIGHEYSLLASLPEGESKWVYPISVQRVPSHFTGPKVGAKQIREIAESKSFQEHLLVNVCDTAYSINPYIKEVEKLKNVVTIARLRSNRVLNRNPRIHSEQRKGRPQRYGEKLCLKDPSQADEEVILIRKTKKGHELKVQVERWKNIFSKGKEQCAPFDTLRIRVWDKEGNAVYKKALWLAIIGERRLELTLEEILDAYLKRFDLENFFRFSKKNLLIDKFQTPEVEHEENWWWLCMVSYLMLYMAKSLAEGLSYPWEKKGVKKKEELTPSQVQREYERIIRQTGLESAFPKRRGKSSGRKKGQKTKGRSKHPVIKKSRSKIKKLKKAAKAA